MIDRAFDKGPLHHLNFKRTYDKSDNCCSSVEKENGILMAAKNDFDGGFTFYLQSEISSLILVDFVALVKEAPRGKHKDVAAVLACTALEDEPKRFAEIEGLDIEEKPMTQVISALKSKGLVGDAQKALLKGMPKA